MTLTARTTAATGDHDRGMMATEFGRMPMLSSLTRTRGGGGGGTRHGSNDNNYRIDDCQPPRMLVGMPMPVVRYHTNLDFPGINLPPLLHTRTIPGGLTMPRTPSANFWMSQRSWCRGRICSTMTGGARQSRPSLLMARQDVRCCQAEAGGSGAPMAIVVIFIVVPSVGMRLLAVVQASRRHLRTRLTGHGPMSS
jgi:hypothetical protein